jgi:hypothetical protein
VEGRDTCDTCDALNGRGCDQPQAGADGFDIVWHRDAIFALGSLELG